MQSQPLETGFLEKLSRQWLNWLGLLAMAALGLGGIYVLHDPEHWQRAGLWGIVSLGLLGLFRWSWFLVQLIRSRIYLYWVFPRWRRRANRVPMVDVPSIGIVIPTFREDPRITERVFRAIALEAQSLSKRLTLVAVTTPEEIIDIERIIRAVDPELQTIEYLPILDPAGGKRKALAVGLRALAAAPVLPEIVCLMDGDSIMELGALRKCLPFFALFPKLGGLTTNEKATVIGSQFFEEWLELRFAQRHLYMASHSLSNKILCLTGRFSLYRGEAALAPSFADLLESDMLNDWLWGKFKFLSGDDKSTWYWTLKHGYDLIYVPDVMVDTIETVSGNIPLRMYQNQRRWFGNMLRNGSRAIALGPRRVGWFVWYCLLDQRISFWTSLVSPALMLLYALQGRWVGVGLILSWLLFSRPLTLLIYAWGRDFEIKPLHVVQLLLSQWSSSLIKIYTQMNLAQQKWSNRGNQSRSVGGTGLTRLMQQGTSRFLLVAQGFSFTIALLCLTGALMPQLDLQSWLWHRSHAAIVQPVQIVEAANYGVKSDDEQDDAPALQRLLDRLPAKGLIQVNLPAGELLLASPLKIHRNQTVIKGWGQSRSILRVLNTAASELDGAAITLAPQGKAEWLEQVGLERLTLVRESSAGTNVAVRNTRRSWLKNLQFMGSGTHAVVLKQTEGMQIEYLAFDGQFTKTPLAWIEPDASLKASQVSSNVTQ